MSGYYEAMREELGIESAMVCYSRSAPKDVEWVHTIKTAEEKAADSRKRARLYRALGMKEKAGKEQRRAEQYAIVANKLRLDGKESHTNEAGERSVRSGVQRIAEIDAM